jgi:hypothetical protein
MSRNRGNLDRLLFWRIQHYSRISLGVLLAFTSVSGVFVYQVSPLRDPAFQPNSANAGTLIPWLRGIRESDWLLGATVQAGLLSVNSVLLLWQVNRIHRTTLVSHGLQEWSSPIVRLLLVGNWLGVGALLFSALWLLFFAYLSGQWLID